MNNDIIYPGNSRIYFGYTLIIGAVSLILTNSILSPQLDPTLPFPDTASGSLFIVRMIASLITSLLLLISLPGFLFSGNHTRPVLRYIAIILAFTGTSFLLANEWYQVFVIPEIAAMDPELLLNLEAKESLSLYDLGAIIAISVFTLGWILLAMTCLAKDDPQRRGAILLITGFFFTPVVSFITPYPSGMILGNLVIGAGFFLMGYAWIRN